MRIENVRELKKIIKGIEKYASVMELNTKTSCTVIPIPRTAAIREIDLRRPQTYQVTFMLGSKKTSMVVKKPVPKKKIVTKIKVRK